MQTLLLQDVHFAITTLSFSFFSGTSVGFGLAVFLVGKSEDPRINLDHLFLAKALTLTHVT